MSFLFGFVPKDNNYKSEAIESSAETQNQQNCEANNKIEASQYSPFQIGFLPVDEEAAKAAAKEAEKSRLPSSEYRLFGYVNRDAIETNTNEDVNTTQEIQQPRRRALVTGASGLLGRAVMRELSSTLHWEVKGLAFKRATQFFEKVDITKQEELRVVVEQFKVNT